MFKLIGNIIAASILSLMTGNIYAREQVILNRDTCPTNEEALKIANTIHSKEGRKIIKDTDGKKWKVANWFVHAVAVGPSSVTFRETNSIEEGACIYEFHAKLKEGGVQKYAEIWLIPSEDKDINQGNIQKDELDTRVRNLEKEIDTLKERY